MASRPLPPPDAATRVPSPSTQRRRPRYGLRRAAVGGALAALLVAAGVTVFLLGRDDSGDDETGSDVPGWDRIAAIDPDSGDVTVVGDDGQPAGDAIDVGVDDARILYTSGDTLFVDGDAQAAVVDLGSGDVWTVDLPDDADLRPVRGTTAPVFIAVTPAGGPALLIDTEHTVDVGELAGISDGIYFYEQATSDPAGAAVLLPEARSFQTVLAPLGGGDAEFYAGAGVAVTADSVVTVERAGPEAEIVVTPRRGGDERRIATTDLAGVSTTSTGGLVVVSEDGTVSTVAADADESDESGELDLSGEATVDSVIGFPAIDRLLVVAGEQLFLLDATNGDVVATLDGELGLGVPTGDPRQRCQAVVTGDGLSALDLVDGTVSADAITGVDRVAGASLDGCTIVGLGGAAETILHAGSRVEVTDDEHVAAIAPDGSAYVTVDRDGTATLRPLGDADADPVALDVDAPALFTFVEAD